MILIRINLLKEDQWIATGGGTETESNLGEKKEVFGIMENMFLLMLPMLFKRRWERKSRICVVR
jgi:hypothetical protein